MRQWLRKAATMGTREVVHRTTRQVRDWWDEGRHALGIRYRDDGALVERDGLTALESRWIDFTDAKWIRTYLWSEEEGYARAVLAAADAIVGHEFLLLGVSVRFPGRVLWNCDPVSGREWPRRYHTRLPIFSGDREYGDVKYVWELNRQQFLATLGKAYLLTGEPRYAESALELVETWIEDNPYKVGVNWASGLEVAVRALSWCWALDMFRGVHPMTGPPRQRILAALYEHGRYIEENLSFFFSPYNHLVGEAAALFAIGSTLRWLRRGVEWGRKGWSILETVAQKQFYPDGGPREQSVCYHHFTIGFYVQALVLRHRLLGSVDPRLPALLERAFEFSLYLMRPDGSWPMIGDGDEGRAVELTHGHSWDFRWLLAVGGALFARGDLKRLSRGAPPDGAWLVGREAWTHFLALPEEEPIQVSRAFPESGYTVMRSGWGRGAAYLVFDCGEIADGVRTDNVPSSAHGHADALSIDVAACGRPIVVDPGFYTYNGHPNWHRYFRETEAHNTVVVDGRSQAEYRGRLRWSHGPSTMMAKWVTGASVEYVEGRHTGYTRLESPVAHHRAVLFMNREYWIVRDELTGTGVHVMDRFFHLAPNRVERSEVSRPVWTTSDPPVLFVAAESEGIELQIIENVQEPGGGWIATGYGRKVRAPMVRLRSRVAVPVAVHTVIVPAAPHATQVVIARETLQAEGSAFDVLRINMAGREDTVVFRSEGGVIGPRSEVLYTDGRVAWLRRDDAGIVACGVIEGSVLAVEGKVLLRMTRAVTEVEFWRDKGLSSCQLSDLVEVSSDLLER